MQDNSDVKTSYFLQGIQTIFTSDFGLYTLWRVVTTPYEIRRLLKFGLYQVLLQRVVFVVLKSIVLMKKNVNENLNPKTIGYRKQNIGQVQNMVYGLLVVKQAGLLGPSDSGILQHQSNVLVKIQGILQSVISNMYSYIYFMSVSFLIYIILFRVLDLVGCYQIHVQVFIYSFFFHFKNAQVPIKLFEPCLYTFLCPMLICIGIKVP